MPKFDPDKFLRNLRGRIAFFPCSGVRLKEVMKGPFDILICADLSSLPTPRTTFDLENAQLIKATYRTTLLHMKGNRWLFFFSQENHDVLKRIRDSGHKISIFIAQDNSGPLDPDDATDYHYSYDSNFEKFKGPKGKEIIKQWRPTEASNYERVDSLPNFVEVLENAKFPFLYYTHEPRDEYKKIFEEFLRFERIDCPKTKYNWYKWLYCYKITVINEFPSDKIVKTNNLTVFIKFGNILNHLKGLDCVILPKRYRWVQHLKRLKKVVFLDSKHYGTAESWSWESDPVIFMKKILEYGKFYRLNAIGTEIFGIKKKYKGLIAIIEKICREWQNSFPKEIHIFYVNPKIYELIDI